MTKGGLPWTSWLPLEMTLFDQFQVHRTQIKWQFPASAFEWPWIVKIGTCKSQAGSNEKKKHPMHGGSQTSKILYDISWLFQNKRLLSSKRWNVHNAIAKPKDQFPRQCKNVTNIHQPIFSTSWWISCFSSPGPTTWSRQKRSAESEGPRCPNESTPGPVDMTSAKLYPHRPRWQSFMWIPRSGSGGDSHKNSKEAQQQNDPGPASQHTSSYEPIKEKRCFIILK